MALAANALTTVATVEDELGISSGTENARLQRMINAASAHVQNFCNRTFYRDTAIAETVSASEGPYMILARPPINSITSVVYSGSTIDSSEYEIHNANSGILYAVAGSWGRTGLYYGDISQTRAMGMERKLYTVTYDGGWYTPKQDDDDEDVTRDLPYDIEQAVLYVVAYMRRQMGRDPSVASESLLSSSVSYASVGGAGGSDWLTTQIPAAASILSRYRIPVLR